MNETNYVYKVFGDIAALHRRSLCSKLVHRVVDCRKNNLYMFGVVLNFLVLIPPAQQ